MKLRTAVNQYIAYRQTLGADFKSSSGRLKAFVREMGPRINLVDVKSEFVSKYLAGKTPIITSNWHEKHHILRGFYRYAFSRGYITTLPLPVVIPKRPPPFVPYIYSVKELRALFDACLSYQKMKSWRLEPYTIRMLLLLLYGAGLRISESIYLTLADVDLIQSLITIRETKFYKTRYVPLGNQLNQALLQYIEHRQSKKYPSNPDAPFFIGGDGKALNRSVIGQAFSLIRKKAGIRRTDGASCQPRIHDLRHTFAVHRLIAWYKAGSDVQRLLPILSVYMGHVCLESTSTYLTMTPTLLEEAGRRFEQYAFKENFHD